MNVTQKHRYALSAMVQLGLNFSKGPVQLRLISDAANIPHSYLEQLVLDLKKVGLVVSTRGAKGGYQLSRSPQSISVKEIFSAIEPLSCEFKPHDQLSFFWDQFNHHINDYLSETLQELIESIFQREKVLTYSI